MTSPDQFQAYLSNEDFQPCRKKIRWLMHPSQSMAHGSMETIP